MRRRWVLGLGFLAFAGGCDLVLGLGDYQEGGGGGSGTSASTGQPATCGDQKRDGNETDVDCGGECGPCDDTRGCLTAADCKSKVCGPSGACSAPSCTDQVQNGSETALDCGGGCPGCGVGATCEAPTDCLGGDCQNGVCQPTCTDHAKNGDETGEDCGGSCGPCALGVDCLVDHDCQSDICLDATCSNGLVFDKVFGNVTGSDAVNGFAALDSKGNIVIAGTASGDIDFGGGSGSTTPLDAFVARFDGMGNHIVHKRYGDGGNQSFRALAIDKTNNEIVAGGSYAPTISYGSTTWPQFGGIGDIHFARLGTDAGPLWSKATGSATANAIESTQALAVDGNGNVFVSANFSGNVTIDGTPLTASGNGDFMLLKYGSTGSQLRAKRYGDVSNQTALSLVTDAAGNLLVAGNNSGTIDFTGGSVTSPGGDADIFLAKLDGGTLAHVWSHEYGDTSNQLNPEIALAPNGDIVMVGELNGSITFGSTTLMSAGSSDIFVARFAADGTPKWARAFGDDAAQAGPHVATDELGNVYVFCRGNGVMNFGGTDLVSAGGPLAGTDLFLAKLGPGGAHIWSTRFGDDHDQTALSIAYAGNKQIVFTATFDGKVNFGGADHTNAGGLDLALVRMATPDGN